MSSATCFNLDQPRILSSGNGLNIKPKTKPGTSATWKQTDLGSYRAVTDLIPRVANSF